METIRALMEQSKAEGRTITFFVGTHQLEGVVQEIGGDDTVTLSTPHYLTLVVKVDQIQAAALAKGVHAQ